jgi:hypothetical protein
MGFLQLRARTFHLNTLGDLLHIVIFGTRLALESPTPIRDV